jgi:DNA polymerase III alpha subunit
MHNTIDLLCDYGYAERKPTLKETYEDIIGIYNLEREDEKMWEMVWNHEVTSLFQLEQQSGVQGIALTKPRSVDELAVLNSVSQIAA